MGIGEHGDLAKKAFYQDVLSAAASNTTFAPGVAEGVFDLRPFSGRTIRLVPRSQAVTVVRGPLASLTAAGEDGDVLAIGDTRRWFIDPDGDMDLRHIAGAGDVVDVLVGDRD